MIDVDDEYLEMIKTAIQKATGYDVGKISLASDLRNEMNLSSLDFVDIFFELEALTNIQLNFRDFLFHLQSKSLGAEKRICVSEIVQHLKDAGATKLK